MLPRYPFCAACHQGVRQLQQPCASHQHIPTLVAYSNSIYKNEKLQYNHMLGVSTGESNDESDPLQVIVPQSLVFSRTVDIIPPIHLALQVTV